MKKLIVLVIMLCSTLAFTQEKITVDTKDLPPELVQQLKQRQQVSSTLETYGEWAGIGKEIGVAMKEGLTAVKDVAIDFSKTDVGLFTMVLIAWKVVGQDVMGLGVGLIVLVIGISFLSWSYRRTCMSKRVCIEDAGWFKAKKYQVVESPYKNIGDTLWGMSMLHLIGLFLLIAVVAAMVF